MLAPLVLRRLPCDGDILRKLRPAAVLLQKNLLALATVAGYIFHPRVLCKSNEIVDSGQSIAVKQFARPDANTAPQLPQAGFSPDRGSINHYRQLHGQRKWHAKGSSCN